MLIRLAPTIPVMHPSAWHETERSHVHEYI